MEFGRLIGRGTFGQVHRGKWKEKTVALKRIAIPPGSDTSNLPKEIEVLRFVMSIIGLLISEAVFVKPGINQSKMHNSSWL